MVYAPKNCPKCGGTLDADWDFEESGRDRVVYECADCGWMGSK